MVIFDNLTHEQRDVFQKFKNCVSATGYTSPYFTDSYLMRFLVARKFDLLKTNQMWSNFINWRKEINVDAPFHYEELPEVKKYFPHAYFKTDKQGRPIYIERVGQLNYDAFLSTTTKERFIRYYITLNERLVNEILPKCSIESGREITQTFYIMDLTGMTWKTASKGVLDLTKALLTIGNNYYPELMGEMWIVNAPFIFGGVWKIVQWWVDDKTRSKVHIVGSDFKKHLLAKVDPENLPDFLGGTATVEEYGEYLTKEQGPWVQKEENISVKAQKVEENTNFTEFYEGESHEYYSRFQEYCL